MAIVANFQGKEYFAFPDPSDLACLKIEDLFALQFTRKKAEYLIGIAKKIEMEELHLDDLAKYDDLEKFESTLLKIHGVGKWTAQYVAMKWLRHSDAFPLTDVGLHNALKYQLNLSAKPLISEIEKIAEKWVPWRGYATFYLWRSLLDV
jgi:DNA-3-methyladenine glycosylase II